MGDRGGLSRRGLSGLSLVSRQTHTCTPLTRVIALPSVQTIVTALWCTNWIPGMHGWTEQQQESHKILVPRHPHMRLPRDARLLPRLSRRRAWQAPRRGHWLEMPKGGPQSQSRFQMAARPSMTSCRSDVQQYA